MPEKRKSCRIYGSRYYQLYLVRSERSPGAKRRDWGNRKSVDELKPSRQKFC